MALSIDQLHTLVSFMVPDVQEKYPHMVPILRALLGGYVLPEMASLEPEAVEGNKAFEALIAEFTPERIAEMLEPGEITKRIPVIMDVPDIKSKTVVVKDGEKVIRRRERSEVHKISRKKHDLYSYERDMVIILFNKHQDMLNKTDEVFKTLVDTINSKREEDEKISAPQLAGYWSLLCRMSTVSPERREAWVKKCLKKGIFSVAPESTPEFRAKIIANSKSRKKEASERAKDKREGVTVRVVASEMASELPKAKIEEPESVPSKTLDLADIL